MSRRRTRFTATVIRPGSNPAREVILAYNAATVRDFYERRGFIVTNIVKGDYRAEARKAERAAGGGWTLDRAALREAIDLLGLTLPVEVKQTGARGGRYGCHTFAPRAGTLMKNPALDTAHGGMVHKITVKNWLKPEQAGRTLWHELTHAMQAERACRAAGAVTEREHHMAWRNSNERGHGTSYQRKPVEVEAREHESLNDDLPLAR